MAGGQAIRVEHLSKWFGARPAFEDVTFDVGEGEVFGFLGPNGAGKTTMVRALAGLVKTSSGKAEVAGIEVKPERGSLLRWRISVMPENPGLYLKLSVQENLQFFAGLYGVEGAEARVRIENSLRAVDMWDRRFDLGGSLSKGLRQRVGLARALLNDPQVLFLDEPTSGLDPESTREVRELVNGLRSRGTTVFLTTHRLEEAERICDRVAVLNTKLVTVGTPGELRKHLFATALDVRLSQPLDNPVALFSGVRGVKEWAMQNGSYIVEVEDVDEVAPVLAKALVDAGAGIVRLAEVQHTLEDVYMELIDQ
jgi:ABC-2 type transport system ATP-binding protein